MTGGAEQYYVGPETEEEYTGGGMAPQRAFQDTYRSYRRKGRFVIIKMLDLERRLY